MGPNVPLERGGAGDAERVAGAEEFFVQLVEGDALSGESGADAPAAEEVEEVRSVLKFLLALHLERKRVLRPQGRISSDGSQVYRHGKRDREYRIYPVEVDAEMFRRIEEQLDLVLV